MQIISGNLPNTDTWGGVVYLLLFEIFCALVILRLLFQIYSDFMALRKEMLEKMLFSALQSYDKE